MAPWERPPRPVTLGCDDEGGEMGDMDGRPVVGAIDDSESGVQALRVAGRLAEALGAPLVIATVASPPPVARRARFRLPSRAGAGTGARARGDAVLAAAAAIRRSAVAADVPDHYAASVRLGDPATELLALGHGLSPRAMVLGSRRPGPAAGSLLGRVSAAVLGEARWPVAVVPDDVDDARRRLGSRHGRAPAVVCDVTDPSGPGGTVGAAARICGAIDGRLILAHAVPDAAAGGVANPPAEAVLELVARSRRERAAWRLHQAAEQAGVRGSAELRAPSGGRVRALLDLSESEDAALIALSGRRSGRPVGDDPPLELVTEARCPVLVVPPGASPVTGSATTA